MEQTILFSHEGALSPAELNWETPLLYQGSTKLYDKTNDPARSFLSSVTIPRPIAQKLTAINGKCQLTQAHGIFRSAHVFSPKAEFIDGLERICYLEYKEKGLLSENTGAEKQQATAPITRFSANSCAPPGLRSRSLTSFWFRKAGSRSL